MAVGAVDEGAERQNGIANRTLYIRLFGGPLEAPRLAVDCNLSRKFKNNGDTVQQRSSVVGLNATELAPRSALLYKYSCPWKIVVLLSLLGCLLQMVETPPGVAAFVVRQTFSTRGGKVPYASLIKLVIA